MPDDPDEVGGVMRWEAEGLFVKVCGLSTIADVEAAAEAGASAVGFVHWGPSPRHRDLGEIRRLADASPVTTVLVTVDLDSASLLDASSRAGVDAVQVHGEHAAVAAAAARRMGLGVIRPMKADQPAPDTSAEEILLVDTPDTGLPGGSGRSFDWDTLGDLGRPFLLAGGLDADNVAGAVRKVRPFGVDASSGLESTPGRKDPDLIRRYVRAAREAL